MRKKPAVLRFPKAKAVAESADETWHNGADVEIMFYAKSLQNAARAVIANLDLEPNPKTARMTARKEIDAVHWNYT